MTNTFYHTPILDHAAVVQGMLERLSKSQAEAHRALWPEMYRALDEANAAVIDDTQDIYRGDMHEAEEPEACEGEAFTYCGASCVAAHIADEHGIVLVPILCDRCDQWHLVLEAPARAGKFGVD